MVTSFLKSGLEEGADEEKDDWSYYAERETEAQGGEFIHTQVTGKKFIMPSQDPPLNLWQTFNIQNIPKLNIILTMN